MTRSIWAAAAARERSFKSTDAGADVEALPFGSAKLQ